MSATQLFARALALALLLLAALACAGGAAQAALPPIHHVYVIVLENESASTTFAPSSPAPFLSRTLRAQGAYLPNYFGIGHFSNDNYIAMISGQAPNADTQADCQLYSDFAPGATGALGQMPGAGCIYPSAVPTIVSQLRAARLTWRDYNDGMGADPKREPSVCGHPPVNGRDNTQGATALDRYATRHNPFVYFHSIIDDTTLCDTHVVTLDPLTQDLAGLQAPNYVFITPDLCNDGHDAKCSDGGPGGLARADTFLRRWVPVITRSSAFKRDGGLLMILFDEAANSDRTSCCGEIPGPGSASPGIGGPGGGDVGAVLLSPYIAAKTVSQVPYNHYTMLRSVEDLFRLPHLGYARLPGGRSFGSDIFACAPRRAPIAVKGRLPDGSEISRVRLVRRGGREQLTLYSVGGARLRIAVAGARRRPLVVRRELVPCRAYTFGLPAGRGLQVKVSAFGAGGAQTVELGY